MSSSAYRPQPFLFVSTRSCTIPKGPCAQIVYNLPEKYLNRAFFKANVYPIWVHGPLGSVSVSGPEY